MTKKIKQGTNTYFNKNYIKTISSQIPKKMTREQVSFIIKRLNLKKGMRVLDIGCGDGRHSLEFARRGYEVTGIDTSSDLLRAARKSARSEKLPVRFLKQDMGGIAFNEEEKFDVAISMFSFGFLKKRSDHEHILQNSFTALKSGGRFFLATGNFLPKLKEVKNYIAKHPKEKIVTKKTEKTLLDGTVISIYEIADIKNLKQTIKKQWLEKGQKYTDQTTIHIFTPQQIKDMVRLSGFKAVDVFGNFDGTKFTNKMGRFLVVAKK